MPANPAIEKRNLAFVLGQSNPSNLFVRVAISGEVQVSADVNGMPVTVLLEPGKQYDLLGFAPVTSWRLSTTLFTAVDNGWLFVDVTTQPSPTPPPNSTPTPCCGIVPPTNPQTGDLLIWDGMAWSRFTPGTSGNFLQSNGPGSTPAWASVAGSSAGSISGQTTTGVVNGQAGYVSAANTWLKAQNDGTRLQATCSAVNTGTVGSMSLPGNVISAAQFTTAGGSPANDSEVYLAAGADDAGSGAGKFTATAPSSGFLVPLGVCVDNSGYAGAKTCKIIFNPSAPIQLL